MLFVYLMQNQKPLKSDIVSRHVEFLKDLHRQKKLVLCGPFQDYPGGMVIIHAKDKEEAVAIAESDPLLSSGCKTYELRTFQPANEENNYLL